MSTVVAESPSAERSEVTSVIRHKVKDSKSYEKWLQEIVPVAATFPGHRGVDVIRPVDGASEYTIVLHFDTIEHLRAWLNSTERRKLIEKALPILAGEDSVEIKTGLEFWFTPPSRRPIARPYKQFLVTLSVIYPLTIIVPIVLTPVLDRIPYLSSFYLRQLLADAAIVALLIYVIMPRYVRLLSGWLYR
jgi:uncharacterized protein